MRWITSIVVALVVAIGLTSPAAAHTEPDLVAVPASSEATLTLRPIHGCGDSPTVQLSIRAPVEEAIPGEVDGWTASAEPDGEGNTILTWADGLLPSDQEGAFPVTFVVPDTVGELLLFPAVQECENGEELAWISGDPESDFPAPRILVLPEGSEPASSIDDVPNDAPGRDQLVEVVDTDQPGVATTTTTMATSTTSTTTTIAPSDTTTSSLPPPDVEEAPGEVAAVNDGGAGAGPVVWVVIGLLVVVVAAAIVLRRRA